MPCSRGPMEGHPPDLRDVGSSILSWSTMPSPADLAHALRRRAGRFDSCRGYVDQRRGNRPVNWAVDAVCLWSLPTWPNGSGTRLLSGSMQVRVLPLAPCIYSVDFPLRCGDWPPAGFWYPCHEGSNPSAAAQPLHWTVKGLLNPTTVGSTPPRGACSTSFQLLH